MAEVVAKPGWGPFLKEIARVGTSGDLSSLTAPPFILSPTSLVEYASYWAEPEALLLKCVDGSTPEERMLLVLEWVVSTFQGQFGSREAATGTEKKPLNPVLGETFSGHWSKTTLRAEQVSHHPPRTAYSISAPGIELQGHCAQKTSFSGRTILVKQLGHAILTLALPGGREDYLITLPKLNLEGIFFGSPYVELTDKSFIQASSGYRVGFEYKGKGYISGVAKRFIANITGPKDQSLYTVAGQWSAASTYTAVDPAATNARGVKVGDIFANFDKAERTTIQVKPITEQSDYESRRLWQDVADGIRAGNFEKAQAAKVKIENAERQKRKDETAAVTPFQTKFFTLIEDDPVYHQLASLCQHKPDHEGSYKYIGPAPSL